MWSLLLLTTFTTSAIATGDPNALFGCLRNKGYNLETISNPNFAADTAAFNRRLHFTPTAIVFPQSAQNVSDIVHCAATNNFKVSARSGGHSYAAFGLGGQNGNVIVDLKNLKDITLLKDGVTVVAGTGNHLGDLAQGIFDKGKRALPHGTCPYVGSGGHASYGGFGLFSRKAGLLLDHTIAAQVVLANGTIVTASNTSNPDLFWALRGAGPSFGIVTAWTFATLPAQDSIGFQITYPVSLTKPQFVQAYSAFQNFSVNLTPDLGFDGDISPDGNGGIAISFLGFWWGNPADFNKTMAPFLKAIPAGFNFTPKTYGWIEGLEFLAGSPTLSTAAPDGTDTFFVKSLMTKGPSSLANLNSFANFLYTSGVNSPTGWFIGFDLYQGAISQVPKDATSYENRDAFITYQFYASSGNQTFPAAGIPFVANMLNSLEPNPVAAYPNYIDPTLTGPQWRDMYFRTHYPRLLTIKNSVDPNDVFDFPQAIGRA